MSRRSRNIPGCSLPLPRWLSFQRPCKPSQQAQCLPGFASNSSRRDSLKPRHHAEHDA